MTYGLDKRSSRKKTNIVTLSEEAAKFAYIAYPTPMQLHVNWKGYFVRAITGPFGSGKSVACINDLLYIAMRQEPNSRGERHVRFGIIRATYPNLRTTTKKTIEMWLPRQCGGIKETAPMEGYYEIPLVDGTRVCMELLLLAIEDEKDVEKLKSTDFTCVFLNEVTEVSQDVLTTAIARINRYPSKDLGKCSYSCVLMDFNQPPYGHWLHKVFPENSELEDGYVLYKQPPAMFKHVDAETGDVTYEINPGAENLEPLGGIEYYIRQYKTKMSVGDIDGIDQLLCMLTTDDKSGKPVWSTFSRAKHVAPKPIEPLVGESLMISIDTSGLHAAAAFWQFIKGKWCITDEVMVEGEGFEAFVEGALKPLILNKYRPSSILAVCDPANARDSLKGITPVSTLIEHGIPAIVAPTNDIKPRIDSVFSLLNKDIGGVLISPTCRVIIEAMAGKYQYKKLSGKSSSGAAYAASPAKNDWSHIADAVQYGALRIAAESLTTTPEQSEIGRAFSKKMNKRRVI